MTIGRTGRQGPPRASETNCTISAACKSTRFSTDFHKSLLLRFQPQVSDNGGGDVLAPNKRKTCVPSGTVEVIYSGFFISPRARLLTGNGPGWLRPLPRNLFPVFLKSRSFAV